MVLVSPAQNSTPDRHPHFMHILSELVMDFNSLITHKTAVLNLPLNGCCVSELEMTWKVYSGVALPLGTHIPTSLCFHFFSCFLDWLSYLVEKAMAPHSSALAWKIPWAEEPSGLQSMGSLRVGHD